MKKISIIFAFFTIIMCLFFLPEVWAINYDTACTEAEKAIGNDDIYVIVEQGSMVAHKQPYESCNSHSKLTSIVIDPSTLTFRANEDIAVFIYTEEGSVKGGTKAISVNPDSVRTQASKCEYHKTNGLGTLSYIKLRLRSTRN